MSRDVMIIGLVTIGLLMCGFL